MVGVFSEWLFSTFKILYVNTTQNRSGDKKKNFVNFTPISIFPPVNFLIFRSWENQKIELNNSVALKKAPTTTKKNVSPKQPPKYEK